MLVRCSAAFAAAFAPRTAVAPLIALPRSSSAPYLTPAAQQHTMAAAASGGAASPPRGDPSLCELSGALSSEAKWASTWAALAAPACQIASLRVLHNSDAQAARTAGAIAGGGAGGSLAALEVAVVGEEGAAALAAALEVCVLVVVCVCVCVCVSACSSCPPCLLPRYLPQLLSATGLSVSLSQSQSQSPPLPLPHTHAQNNALKTTTTQTATSLTSLKLHQITTDAAAAALAPGLAACAAPLRALSFGGLAARSAEHLAGALSIRGSSRTVQRVELFNSSLDAGAAAALCQALAVQPCLEDLVLSAVRDALPLPGQQQQQQQQRQQGADPAPPAIAALLGAALHSHPALRTLTLTNTALPPPAAAALGALAASRAAGAPSSAGPHPLPPLRLTLTDCMLTEEGAAALAAGISSGGRLEALQLERCGLTAAAADLLGAAAARCGGLRQFVLVEEAVGSEGAEGVAAALVGHPQLKELAICSAGVEGECLFLRVRGPAPHDAAWFAEPDTASKH